MNYDIKGVVLCVNAITDIGLLILMVLCGDHISSLSHAIELQYHISGFFSCGGNFGKNVYFGGFQGDYKLCQNYAHTKISKYTVN